MRKTTKLRRQSGFTLLETMIAMAVLSFGVLSVASFFTQGLKNSYQAQITFIAQQKAQEAMETIFTARDTKLLTWAQIANVSQGGVFNDNAQPLCAPGPDGLFGTNDDDCNNPDGVDIAPGPDNIFGTADDVQMPLNPWMTRTIAITPVPSFPNLNKITVTVAWVYEGQAGQFQIVSYISSYS